MENELNLFQSKLIQLTISLNAKLEKVQEMLEDGLTSIHKNDNLLLKAASSSAPSERSDGDEDEQEDDEDAEILVLDDAESTSTMHVAGRRESQLTVIDNGEVEINDTTTEEKLQIESDGNNDTDNTDNRTDTEEKSGSPHDRYGTMIKHKPNTDNLLHSINYNQKIYSETIVQELRRQNEELSHEVKKLKLERQQNSNSLKLTPKTHSGTATLVYTPYSNISDNHRSPTIDFGAALPVNDLNQEQNDTYYICDDDEVYQNINYNGNKAQSLPGSLSTLKINCNAKKMDSNKTSNDNTPFVPNTSGTLSCDISPRSSGKGSVKLSLLKENRTLSEQLDIMQKMRQMDKDNLDLLQSPIKLDSKFDRSTISPRDSITLLNTHLMQQLKLERSSGSASSSGTYHPTPSLSAVNPMANPPLRSLSHNQTMDSITSNTTFYTTPTPSSARSSVNSNSILSTTVDSIDEHLEKWNTNIGTQPRLSAIDIFNKRRSSGKTPVSVCSNTNNAPDTPQAQLSTPQTPQSINVDDREREDSLNCTPTSPDKQSVHLEHTPTKLEQSLTMTVPYGAMQYNQQNENDVKEINQAKMDDDMDPADDDIKNFDDNNLDEWDDNDLRILGELRNKKLPNDDITKFLDDPILREENEDDDEESSEGYDYSNTDDEFYSNNFSQSDIHNANNSGVLGINAFQRTRTDSQIFRSIGMELSKKLKAKSVESPCQSNQRLSSTFALHWINLKK